MADHRADLASAVARRRKQLRLPIDLSSVGGPSEMTVRKVESAAPGDIRPATAARLEKALQWRPGIVSTLLAGSAPADPEAWALTSDAPAQPPVVDLPDLSVEAAVRETVADLPEEAPAHASLVALALTLARKLDEGAGLATAAVARELRSTLDVLTKTEGDGDDELSDFVASLSSPLGHSPVT